MKRFYSPRPIVPGVRVVLDAEEAHHLRVVLRRSKGEAVEVFDVAGRHYRALIACADAARVELDPTEDLGTVARAAPLVLCVAVIKGPRFDWLVEKASELGAERLVPLLTERTTAPPGPGRLARWRRLAIAAAKQCGRQSPCQVSESLSLADAASACASAVRLYLDRGGAPLRTLVLGAASATVVVGPEGGLSTGERALLGGYGFAAASLPGSILRTETAAMAALVIAAEALGSAPISVRADVPPTRP